MATPRDWEWKQLSVSLTNIDKGEMVLPSNFAQQLREYQEMIAQAVSIPSWQLGKSFYATGGLVYGANRKIGPIPSIGVSVGTLTGWRLWRVDGHRLRSVSIQTTVWYPGVPMTGDPDDPHAGVYAFREPLNARWELQHAIGAGALVLGTVKMWGRYVEHERGYRAELAKITSLLATSCPSVDLDELRALYLGLRCPRTLTPVVDRGGRTVGVTTVRPPEARRRWSPYLGGYVEDDPPPVQVSEPMKMFLDTVSSISSTTISYQTHHWRGRSLVLDEDQDPTWLPGWLPLP